VSGRLEGKVAVITGAGQGIGRATAQLFAREGANVLVAEIERGYGSSCVAEIIADGGDAHFLEVDATNEAAVADAFRRVGELYGRLDVLFNCVGGSTSADRPVGELTVDTFSRAIALDVLSSVLCSRDALPLMTASGGGTIINMSSFAAFRGGKSHAYTSAKGAIDSLTRAMAGTYAADGIRVNAIAPGLVLTDRAKARLNDANMAGRVFAWDDYPFGTGRSEDIANIALFLASDESIMINGVTIRADGGITAY
jgi:NAD(P)-dependent dehydrogenase (short-subunit alcohol dehydrogenase family)